MRLLTILTITMFSVTAVSSDYVEKKMEQLKTNSENSETNYKQYQENLDVVRNNIKEIDVVLKDLKHKQQTVQTTVKDAQKNTVMLDKQKAKVQAFKVKEEARIKVEQKQIDELKAKVAAMEKNLQQRNNNVATYEAKVQEIETEKKRWQEQKGEVDAILAEINKKQKTATGERIKWVAKEKDYVGQAKKWKKVATKSQRDYKNYSKLKD